MDAISARQFQPASISAMSLGRFTQLVTHIRRPTMDAVASTSAATRMSGSFFFMGNEDNGGMSKLKRQTSGRTMMEQRLAAIWCRAISDL